MFGKDIVHKNVERSADQATIVIRINGNQWNLAAIGHAEITLRTLSIILLLTPVIKNVQY